ncbi:hypothetical protein [Gottfriedia acidiceleris]|uniref:hypothetical protein n=1 Tax=Gottfriedia acidiceleris TaxID=371036 RepID=UPI00101C8A38|nr:hypothetical protein [Gottfriedia acidiceleris]
MSLYPLSKEENLEKAVEDFNNVVALEIKQWIDEQIKKPDTALVSNERLVVEWNGHKNIFHKVS